MQNEITRQLSLITSSMIDNHRTINKSVLLRSECTSAAESESKLCEATGYSYIKINRRSDGRIDGHIHRRHTGIYAHTYIHKYTETLYLLFPVCQCVCGGVGEGDDTACCSSLRPITRKYDLRQKAGVHSVRRTYNCLVWPALKMYGYYSDAPPSRISTSL